MSPITEVEGRRLALSNLDKVLYPSGFTKAEVLHYYATVADALLPHLHDRPLSLLRYPDGVAGEHFFAKNVPPGAPAWVKTADVPRSEEKTARQVLVDDLPTLMWVANLVTELHTPQWRASAPALADRLVFDLDPGAPADIVQCCAVAGWLRERLAEDGLTAYGKTSGSKGLHLYVPIGPPAPSREVTSYAKALAVEASRALPDLVLHRMTRSLRPGKVFVDFSQNAAAKTTAAPYTLRARDTPAVSAPVTWDEIGACDDPEQLAVRAPDMPERLAAHGDLLADLLDPGSGRPLPELRAD
ncbi:MULTISPECIES: non-homologous end-joining DNA ligase [Streptomyces]|uniref:ATP-dependent DNA ligase n=1 Tax=Streptomyces lycii TaxID=2654337 RepID=A0ABQ7F969_9ACTN|nr:MULTISPECIES: non-homologous end-joining DNA ligase [Streptomyces]KAF4405519.1 ATP-dependent DNA ligase [Streptomyces lycii]PGH48375.1 ATP-dependent DNA ligase [Streptomyces sp. Ru87]